MSKEATTTPNPVSVLEPQPDPAELIADAMSDMSEVEIKCRSQHAWPENWNTIWVNILPYGYIYESRRTCRRCKAKAKVYVDPTTGMLIPGLTPRHDYSGSTEFNTKRKIGRSLQTVEGRGAIRLARIMMNPPKRPPNGKVE